MKKPKENEIAFQNEWFSCSSIIIHFKRCMQLKLTVQSFILQSILLKWQKNGQGKKSYWIQKQPKSYILQTKLFHSFGCNGQDF